MARVLRLLGPFCFGAQMRGGRVLRRSWSLRSLSGGIGDSGMSRGWMRRGRWRESGQHSAQLRRGENYTVRVLRFSGHRWTLHLNHLQRANFGQDKEQPGQRVGANPRFPPVGLPVILSRYPGRFILHCMSFRGVRVRGLVTAMQDGDRIRNAWNKSAHGEAICVDVDAEPPLP